MTGKVQAIGDDVETTPRCMCGLPVIDLGPIFPDPLALAANFPLECARGSGSNGHWTWCCKSWGFSATVRR